MASLNIFFSPAITAGRVYAATAAKKSAGEEKGPFDWILSGLQKEDQLLETDPILKKVEEEKSGGTTGRKSSVAAVPAKKKDAGGLAGLAGLFAKKE